MHESVALHICVVLLCPVQSFHPFSKMDVVLIYLHGFPVGILSLLGLVRVKRSIDPGSENGKFHFMSMSL